MNVTKIGQVWLLITLFTITNVVVANPSEHFLNSVITQLKQSQTEESLPSLRYRSFYDELFGTISRSAEEFQVPEAPEPSENSLHEHNFEYDQSQNQILQQFNELQNQAHFAAGNQLNLVNNADLLQQQQQPAIIGLQQFNVNGYLHLPPPETPAEVTEPSQDVPLQNTGPNLFVPNNAVNPAPVAVATLDPQFLIQHLQNLPNSVHPNDEQQNNEPPVPTYYFFNPDPALNENLIEDPFNGALQPLEGDQLLGEPPGKKIVVEPLFVAMAGFVGIAMIFMSAVLFLPKILTPPPEVSSLKGPQELAALTKLAVETIEGKDCTERIACEVGRAMRSMQVGSKPIKVLEVLLPANLAKQLAQIRKAVANKKTCRLIQCKRTKPNELKAKIAESKIELDADLQELTKPTTLGVDKKQKGKTGTSTSTGKPAAKQPTKIQEPKPSDKKPPKDTEKKPNKEQQDKRPLTSKPPQKNNDEKKPKLAKGNNETEWDFSIFG